MSQRDTIRNRAATVGLLALLALIPTASAQWRRIGNSTQLLGLASPAGGPAERVWFGADGRLFVQLPGGRSYSSADLEAWQAETGAAPALAAGAPAGAIAPEAGAVLRVAASNPGVVYAAGGNAWRSDDGGLNWTNLTAFRDGSILGGAVRDIAIDPTDAMRLVAATTTGVWLSADGGLSWQGVNDGLPNLPVRRILAAPSGVRGLRIAVGAERGELRELEWTPGQRLGWQNLPAASLTAERQARRTLSQLFDAEITAVAQSGETTYAGAADGRLWVSPDGGQSWRPTAAQPNSGAVERIWIDPADRGFALAALSSTEKGAPRLLRTLNGGGFWDDLSSNLPDGPAYGVAGDRATGAIYAATQRGIFFTLGDLRAPAPATPWQAFNGGLPEAPARDVRLDDAGHLLLAALDGYGVYATLAPHRNRQPQVVHSADYGMRAAAPGALLSVLGARVTGATANSVQAPVLAAGDSESQIQVPFESAGDSLQLVVTSAQGRVAFGLPLQSVAPSILIDRDGSPMLIDADSGVQLDAMHPARPGMRVQILMSGLGRVQPAWPTGLAAPLEDAPRVSAAMRASLDSVPLEVTRATLAPGYIGYYLVELQLPELLNAGASELLLEAAGTPSNRVRMIVAQ
ncbi:MAG TPA: hypothetical protein VGK29_12315 [Paludibaculum sp.]|jgi:uncharacterized protein (TIGR03437 family)